jgi:FkbM family methyltransferase
MTGALSAERRRVQTDYPPFDEGYLEWIDVLEAVVAADESFTMIELGAGWGRWLMNAAAAVLQRNPLPIHLIGVEAEPTHFRWMQQHFADNSVDAASLTLIEAAVAAGHDRVRFQVGDPSAWYGQAIDFSQLTATPPPSLLQRIQTFLGRRAPPSEPAVVEVRAVSLPSILQGLHRVDLIDLDLQGVEADVLESAQGGLAKKVKRVHIGTHGEENERRLRTLFGRLGWEKLNDYPSGAEVETPWGRISFQDGVQTWLNTRFAGGASAPRSM